MYGIYYYTYHFLPYQQKLPLLSFLVEYMIHKY